MKLSKQERIAVLVIAVIIILGLGAFLFVVPKFEAIGASNTNLSNKKTELQEARDNAAKKDSLGEQIIEAYNQGRNIADMFFEEMQPYEVDNEVRAFLDYCETNGVKVVVDTMEISEPTTSSLAVTFFTEPEVTYDLKTAAQGASNDYSLDGETLRTAILAAELSNTQTIGSIDVSFTAYALDNDGLIAFADKVNSYIKNQNGNDMRMAVRLSSEFTLEYTDVQAEYAELIAGQEDDLAYDAASQLYKKLNKTIPSKNEFLNGGNNGPETTAQPDGSNQQEGKEEYSPADYVKELECKLTFYSLERMQDPTQTLAEQNNM